MRIIPLDDQYFIQAKHSLADQTRLVLKHGDTFLVADRHGDIRPLGFEDHGLFHKETRFLSRCVLRISDNAPPLLSSGVKQMNDIASVGLTNPDFHSGDGILIRTGNIYINRSIFIWESCYYEHARVSNYALSPVQFTLSFEFDADFADIFEVRGMQRKSRGELLKPKVGDGSVSYLYRGLDNIQRTSRIALSPAPKKMQANRAQFVVKLGPHQDEDFYFTVCCEIQNERTTTKVFDQAYREMERKQRRLWEDGCTVETSNGQFNEWIARSEADLHMMLTETEQGLYPHAGIPWFSTVFGRDGIVTSLEALWIHPEWARGVLGYLAARQAREIVREQDAEPGKILHEERWGEMASLKEIPFGSYYGTVDATPLFVILAGAYYQRTADIEFIADLWPSIEKALVWIDKYGDLDGDGFVEYSRHSARGLGNQGWRDSEDAVFHADGSLAQPPIALCEVQGYVYDAKLKASLLAMMLGHEARSVQLSNEAEALRERFEKAFWCEELKTYGMALDGKKALCKVRGSNAAHCLFSGIVGAERARWVAEDISDERFFSGWGIRTIASSEARYNPMSYHNGSVWPHDNALAAFGMARYGFRKVVLKILSGLFDTSTCVNLGRLPELFCGFDRSPGEKPILYPVACHPQAWASAAVYFLLQSCLGLSVQAVNNKVFFDHPVLPSYLNRVTIRNLKIGEACVDLVINRQQQNDVGVNVIGREGSIDVVVTK